jgi:hypothetical protein
MIMEHLVEWELAGETEVLGDFVHNKSHVIWLGIGPGPPRYEAWA